MRSLFAATLLAATALVSVEPAHAQGCLTAEACRAIRMQQQAMQDQAAANAQQHAAVAAQQRQRAELERKHATEAQARALVVRQEADARAAALVVQQQTGRTRQTAGGYPAGEIRCRAAGNCSERRRCPGKTKGADKVGKPASRRRPTG